MLLFGGARRAANRFYEHLEAVRLLSATGEFHVGYGWPDLAALTARVRRQAPYRRLLPMNAPRMQLWGACLACMGRPGGRATTASY